MEKFFAIHDWKFCSFEDDSDTWDCNHLINSTLRFNNDIKILNNIIFAGSGIGKLCSKDKGKTWQKIRPEIISDIFFENGYYYHTSYEKILKSKDLLNWQQVHIADYPKFSATHILSVGKDVYFYSGSSNKLFKYNSETNIVEQKESQPSALSS